MRKKHVQSVGIGILIALTVGACGKSDNQTNVMLKDDDFAKQTVTLKLFNHGAGINTDHDLNKTFIEPIQKKYPNVSVELIKGRKLEELAAAGEIPDLIITSNYYLIQPLDLGLGSDLRDLIKRGTIDLSKFEPEAVNVVKGYGEGIYGKNGEMYGIPFSLNYGLVAYNKDIFDKFGVPYPKDNMTWNQLIDLSQKVTRYDDGTQYIGIDPGPALALSRAYSLPLLDKNREKADLTTEGFQKVFAQAKRIFDYPGQVIDPNKRYVYGVAYFLKERKLALYPYWLDSFATQLTTPDEPGKQFNWDMISYPSYDDRPGIGREVDFHLLMVPQAAKNREAAYRVIELLTGEEAQKDMNQRARLTIMKDKELRKQYARDMKIFEGKNLSGIFNVTPAPLPQASKYDPNIYGFLNDALKSVIQENVDINTALRTANEKANKFIEEKKNQ
ncbi:ABC transporter substrate-binding protein [Paenibacillus sp. GCM10012303]|uniref:ABC transporter substrate-binding protein n=1 Tax=Paenibacillus sp. GCM10012303 TaxID=3317340 RepID=UPI00360F809B